MGVLVKEHARWTVILTACWDDEPNFPTRAAVLDAAIPFQPCLAYWCWAPCTVSPHFAVSGCGDGRTGRPFGSRLDFGVPMFPR